MLGKDSEARGFAGLSSLISEIPDQSKTRPSPVDENTTRRDVRREKAEPVKTEPVTSPQSRTAYRYQTIFIIIAVSLAGVLLWALSFNADNRSSPSIAQRPQTPPTHPSPPPEPIEQKPPIGTDLTLTRPQIRYCLAEKIRIDEMDRIVVNTSRRQVDGFNAAVDDYNLRCSKYKYYKSQFDLAQTEVNDRRAALLLEANRRVAGWR
jgi:hypothetical protein